MKSKIQIFLIFILFPLITSHSQASDQPAAVSEGCELEELLPRYFKAYEKEGSSQNSPRSGRVLSTLVAAQIQNHVFSHLNKARSLPSAQRQGFEGHYLNDLQSIDRFSGDHSMAVFDLARKLQFHWESRFAQPLGLRSSQKKSDHQFMAKTGGTLGIIALGVLLMRSPQNSPKYFRIVRHLLPLTGTWLGSTSASVLSPREFKDFPPAPAHLMQLGLTSESEEEGATDQTLINDFIALTAGVAAASGTAELWTLVKTARSINALSGPAKVTPYVLVGSLLVGAITELGVAQYIEYKEKADLRAEVQNQALALERARRNKDRGKVLVAGERLKRAILAYSLWHWRPIVDVSQSFHEALIELQRTTDSEKTFAVEVKKIQEDYSRSLRTTLDELKYFDDRSTHRFLTLRYLRSHLDDQLPTTADPEIQKSVRKHQQLFNKILENADRQELQCLDSCGRDQLFQRYLDSLESDLFQDLTFEIRSSVDSDHPNRILLQGAALLLADPDFRPLLEAQADELLALVDKNQNLIIESGLFTLRNEK